MGALGSARKCLEIASSVYAVYHWGAVATCENWGRNDYAPVFSKKWKKSDFWWSGNCDDLAPRGDYCL